MDWQVLFNGIAGLAMAAGGWIMKMIYDRLNNHGKRLEEIPSTYARRDDVKDMKQEILHALQRIENKVDLKH